MPSDKHYSRTARARDLISSLINVASSQDTPFHQNRSCYSARIRVLPLYPFDLPFFSSQLCKVTICSRHEMASVQDIKITRAMPCLLCYEMSSPLQKLKCYGFHISRYGAHISVYSPYFP